MVAHSVARNSADACIHDVPYYTIFNSIGEYGNMRTSDICVHMSCGSLRRRPSLITNIQTGQVATQRGIYQLQDRRKYNQEV